MTISATWRIFADKDAVTASLTDHMASIATQAMADRGRALFALAGGGTPLPVYQEFARQRLDWPRLTVIPGDDRLVPQDDPLSNVAMLRRAFADVPAQVRPIAPVTAGAYRAAGDAADAALADLPWPPDLVVLGMGKDGHTASIFPGPDYAAALDATADRRAIGLLPDPLPAEAPVARVTLTRAAIAQSHAVVVLITGEEKRAILEDALARGDASLFPIGRVLAHCAAPVEIYWCP